MIKWGIIGAGNIAHRFCRALAKDKRAKLEAVSCRTMEKAKAFKMIYPCNKAYDSFQKILDDPDIEAVYIALPHYYHYEWIKNNMIVFIKRFITIYIMIFAFHSQMRNKSNII